MRTSPSTGWAPKSEGAAAVQARSLQLVARAPKFRPAQAIAKDLIELEAVAKELPVHRQVTTGLKTPVTADERPRWIPPVEREMPAIDLPSSGAAESTEDQETVAGDSPSFRAYVLIPPAWESDPTVQVPRFQMPILEVPEPANLSHVYRDEEIYREVPAEDLPVITMNAGFEMDDADEDLAEENDFVYDEGPEDHAASVVMVARPIPVAHVRTAPPRTPAPAWFDDESLTPTQRRSLELARRAPRPMSSRSVLSQLRA